MSHPRQLASATINGVSQDFLDEHTLDSPEVFQISRQDFRQCRQWNPDFCLCTPPTSSWHVPPDRLCFYHRSFGNDARLCKGPGTPGPWMSLASVCGANSCVMLANDSTSKATYLVDSGAKVSILPCPRTSVYHAHQHPLLLSLLPMAQRFLAAGPLSKSYTSAATDSQPPSSSHPSPPHPGC